ncbi:MAG: sialidase family protein [Armatimonadota bacterium]
MQITFTKPRLQTPVHWDNPSLIRYLLGVALQVSPTQVAIFANLHMYGQPIDDLENGADAIVFDGLEAIDAASAVPLVRNHEESHPQTGQPLLMVKFPVFGGFVPLGALLPDGRPHPHAGTGFGHCTALGYPADHSVRWPAGESHLYVIHEIQQYRFTGSRFEVLATQRLPITQPLDGWELHNGPLTSAIPDGEDLLFAMTVGRPGRPTGVGITRWRYRADGWWPIECIPVSGEDCSSEASLIRDSDGALLLAARGAGMAAVHKGWLPREAIRSGHFLLWRSTDHGRTWQETMNLPEVTIPGPVTINRTASGQPFFAANAHAMATVDARGNPVAAGGVRTTLCLWPVNAARNGIGTPLVAFDAPARFGPVPGGSLWLVDHPTACVVRLADGKLHTLLCVRVAELAETSGDAPTTSYSGCWVDELIDDGPAVPVWQYR